MGEDEKDLKALYQIIEEEVIPTYYQKQSKWEKMMKASIQMAEKQFTAGRMLNDYYQKMYEKI